MNSYENVKLAAIGVAIPCDTRMAQTILGICNATPNADVCIDMLLGTYTEPTFPVFSLSNGSDKKLRTFVSYDNFRNEISYTEKPKEHSFRDTFTTTPDTWLKGAVEYEKSLETPQV